MLYEGKAKKIFHSSQEQTVVVQFKDSLTAGDGAKKGSFEGKGRINAGVTALLFQLLQQHNIDTHFVAQQSDLELLCKRVEILPLEIVVRNITAGSFCRRYGLEEGRILPEPLVELFLKDDALHDPLITDEAALRLGFVSQTDLSYLKTVTLQINAVLCDVFALLNLQLVDFKLEFGKDGDGNYILADEITQDTIRVWDKVTGEKKDKDRFRRDLGGVEETYESFLSALQVVEFPSVPLSTTVDLVVKLRDGIKDSSGEVTLKSLQRLGYRYVEEVQSGKHLTLKCEGALNSKLLNDLDQMNNQLLTNPLVEDVMVSFRFVRG